MTAHVIPLLRRPARPSAEAMRAATIIRAVQQSYAAGGITREAALDQLHIQGIPPAQAARAIADAVEVKV